MSKSEFENKLIEADSQLCNADGETHTTDEMGRHGQLLTDLVDQIRQLIAVARQMIEVG